MDNEVQAEEQPTKITDTPNQGVLFKNNRKTEDYHADWQGRINVGGTEYYLNAYVKEGNPDNFLKILVRNIPVKPEIDLG